MTNEKLHVDPRLSALTTEARNPASMAIDSLSPLEMVQLMNAEDGTVAAFVADQSAQMATAIEVIAERLRAGGRLIYLGAGTSGRLGVLDATECPPTFNTRPEQVVGLIAGGPPALVRAVEGAEDHPEYGARDLAEIQASDRDVVVGIATSGRTPYVIGGLQYAREIGAFAIGLSCNRDSALEAVADLMIVPVVGPEVISGSTRLKAGTATKLVLNTLTTGAMVRLGKTFGNLMVDLRATNKKLQDRSRRIVVQLTHLSDPEALRLLESCGGEVKTAVVASLGQVAPNEARQQLQRADGHLRTALEAIRDETSPSRVVRYPNLVIGVDGGGTKVLAWLVSRTEGEVRAATVGAVGHPPPLGRGTAGPANPNAVGETRARQHISQAVEEAFHSAGMEPGPVAAICLATAGRGRPGQRESLHEWAEQQGFAKQVIVMNDADAIWESVAVEGPSVTLIAGTGSICLARSVSGEVVRSGGWGYLLGDEGSGYAMGLAALRAMVRAADGRESHALPLQQAVCRQGGWTSLDELVAHVYSRLANDRQQMAALAPVVLELASEGDPLACRLVTDAARDLADMAAAAIRRQPDVTGRWSVLLSGGLLTASEALREGVIRALEESGMAIGTTHVVTDPVWGAVARARRACSA